MISRCGCGVGGHDHAAGGHCLQQRACDRIWPARGDVQVAGGQDFGHGRRSRRPQQPEPIGIGRRLLCQQVRRVIPVMECDVQAAADDGVAQDDADHVGAGP